MSDLFNNYLQDLVYLIKEDYNDALNSSAKEKDDEKVFYQGQAIAYYSVLSLIENQLIAFDSENQLIGKVVPKIGEQAEF